MKGARGKRHRLRMAKAAIKRHSKMLHNLGQRYSTVKHLFESAMSIVRAQAAIIALMENHECGQNTISVKEFEVNSIGDLK